MGSLQSRERSWERGCGVRSHSQNVLGQEGLSRNWSEDQADWGLSRNTGVGTLCRRHWIKGFLARVFSEGVFITVSKRMLLIRTIWSRQAPFILPGFSFAFLFPAPLPPQHVCHVLCEGLVMLLGAPKSAKIGCVTRAGDTAHVGLIMKCANKRSVRCTREITERFSVSPGSWQHRSGPQLRL